MTGPDETDAFRAELRQAGFTPGPRPEDLGVTLRSPESFVDADARGTRRVRWVLPALIPAAVAVVVAVAVLFPRTGTDGPGLDGPGVEPAFTTVAQVFDAASESAGSAAAETLDAFYWRVESVYQQDSVPESRRIVWLGNGRPGRLVDGDGTTKLPPATFGMLNRSLSWEALQVLPTDPGALTRLLLDDVGTAHDPAWQVYKTVGEWLAESPAPPAVRGALWQVLAGLDGATLDGETEDAHGRAGVAVTMTSPTSGDLTYIVDPASGILLQSSHTPGSRGTSTYRVTYLSQGPATRLGK